MLLGGRSHDLRVWCGIRGVIVTRARVLFLEWRLEGDRVEMRQPKRDDASARG